MNLTRLFALLVLVQGALLAQEGLRPTPAAGQSGAAPSAPGEETAQIRPTPPAPHREGTAFTDPEPVVHRKGTNVKGDFGIDEVKIMLMDANLSQGPVELQGRAKYQQLLKKNPTSVYGRRFHISWHGNSPQVLPKLHLRLEIRGLMGSQPTKKTFLYTFENFRRDSEWSVMEVLGEDHKKLGQLVGWKVTLESDGQELAVKRSAMWKD